MLILLEFSQFLLLRLHENLLEDQLILLLALRREGSIGTLTLLTVSETHSVGHGRCFRLGLLEQRFMDRVDPLLLLLVLGDFLRAYYTVELIDFIGMLGLLVVQMLVEGRHSVLHVLA